MMTNRRNRPNSGPSRHGQADAFERERFRSNGMVKTPGWRDSMGRKACSINCSYLSREVRCAAGQKVRLVLLAAVDRAPALAPRRERAEKVLGTPDPAALRQPRWVPKSPNQTMRTGTIGLRVR